MITDTSRFHGSFFTILFEEIAEPVTIEKLTSFGAGSYLLSNRVPVFLKHSTKRQGPWAFNFMRSHQETQQALFDRFGECITVLVCGKDGMAGLTMSEFRQVLNGMFEEQECVIVRRGLKKMYHIKGRDGALDNRVGRRSVYEKLSVALAGERSS